MRRAELREPPEDDRRRPSRRAGLARELLALAARAGGGEDGKAAAKPADARTAGGPAGGAAAPGAATPRRLRRGPPTGALGPQADRDAPRFHRPPPTPARSADGAGTVGDGRPADPVEACLQRLRLELFDAESQLQSLTELLDEEQTAARSLGTLRDARTRTTAGEIQQHATMSSPRIIKRLRRGQHGAGGRRLRRPGDVPAGRRRQNVAELPLHPGRAGLLLGTLAGAGLAYAGRAVRQGLPHGRRDPPPPRPSGDRPHPACWPPTRRRRRTSRRGRSP